MIVPMAYRNLLAEIHNLAGVIKPPDGREESHLQQRRQQLCKWQLLLRYVQLHPFRINGRQPRSCQWQEAMNKVRHLRDREILDFLWQQSEISRNHERGVQDLRPPYPGTCHAALLSFIKQRRNKAMAILKWEEAASREGCYRVDSSFHARTREILERHDMNVTPRAAGRGKLDANDPWLKS